LATRQRVIEAASSLLATLGGHRTSGRAALGADNLASSSSSSTRSAARGRDITVNAIAPRPTATPLFFEGKSQELIDNIAKQVQL
jgi:NAD(P)-dependent dehydrogenase (short-subunit alcohol dehydrogenase family)